LIEHVFPFNNEDDNPLRKEVEGCGKQREREREGDRGREREGNITAVRSERARERERGREGDGDGGGSEGEGDGATCGEPHTRTRFAELIESGGSTRLAGLPGIGEHGAGAHQ